MYKWIHEQRSGSLILIVEDDRVLVKFLSTQLQKQGFRVISAPDVATAVKNVGRGRPRLVLLDVNLPDGTGLDVMRQVRTALTGQVPIIAMSSTRNPTIPKRVVDAGAQAFLPKPLQLDVLWPTMDRLLGQSLVYDLVVAN